MMRRKRSRIRVDEFDDPIKNYDTPEYDDDLVRDLCESEIRGMVTKPATVVDASTPVHEAMATMARLEIGSVMVSQKDRLVGIFSERDVLNRIAGRYAKCKDLPIAEFMTPEPIAAYETDCPAQALNLMAVGGFRHIPVLDVNDRIVGILGPRRLTAYLEKMLKDE